MAFLTYSLGDLLAVILSCSIPSHSILFTAISKSAAFTGQIDSIVSCRYGCVWGMGYALYKVLLVGALCVDRGRGGVLGLLAAHGERCTGECHTEGGHCKLQQKYWLAHILYIFLTPGSQ